MESLLFFPPKIQHFYVLNYRPTSDAFFPDSSQKMGKPHKTGCTPLMEFEIAK
jgi:hypothetical protein